MKRVRCPKCDNFITFDEKQYKTGQSLVFECPECHERFIPDMKSYIMAAHTLTKRKLICPKCGAHRYCKKVLTK